MTEPKNNYDILYRIMHLSAFNISTIATLNKTISLIIEEKWNPIMSKSIIFILMTVYLNVWKFSIEIVIEPRCEKTGFLHSRKRGHRSASL